MNRKRSRPGLASLTAMWVVAVLSLLLLMPTYGAVSSEVSSFRSCDVNSADLALHACGKASLNTGDVMILILFIGSVAIVASLFTHAYRLTKRPKYA